MSDTERLITTLTNLIDDYGYKGVTEALEKLNPVQFACARCGSRDLVEDWIIGVYYDWCNQCGDHVEAEQVGP